MAPIGTKSLPVSPSVLALLLSAISPFSSLPFTATVLSSLGLSSRIFPSALLSLGRCLEVSSKVH